MKILNLIKELKKIHFKGFMITPGQFELLLSVVEGPTNRVKIQTGSITTLRSNLQESVQNLNFPKEDSLPLELLRRLAIMEFIFSLYFVQLKPLTTLIVIIQTSYEEKNFLQLLFF